jgi:hypothetical protein
MDCSAAMRAAQLHAPLPVSDRKGHFVMPAPAGVIFH